MAIVSQVMFLYHRRKNISADFVPTVLHTSSLVLHPRLSLALYPPRPASTRGHAPGSFPLTHETTDTMTVQEGLVNPHILFTLPFTDDWFYRASLYIRLSWSFVPHTTTQTD